MESWEIKFEGIVQGIGFRPFVYQVAQKNGIKGEVSNGVEGVRIQFNADPTLARAFFEDLLQRKPKLAHITAKYFQKIPQQFFENFQIVESHDFGKRKLHLSPDYALCQNCRDEMGEAGNRRESYPFITCTQCGPRFSIIKGLPYDRPLTTMKELSMCEDCLAEYNDPLNRRHFSQTNSCPKCGIKLWLIFPDGQEETDSILILDHIHDYWSQGKIVAIKGIGGFLFTCDAFNDEAVALLRDRKQRPGKPLAVMYPSLDSLDQLRLCEEEKKMLSGPISPIVLVRKTEALGLATGIAEKLGELGVMIPYNPLFEYLLKGYQKPIVATSGNLSGSPILHKHGDIKSLFHVADLVLSHVPLKGKNRPIAFPQDDSVVQFSQLHKQQIIIRRSRGLAPTYFNGRQKLPKVAALATGADMKSSFAFLHEGNFYISPYLGNLSHFDVETRFKASLEQFRELLQMNPKHIIRDLHPEYASSRIANYLSEGAKTYSYQHHKAHFAAVLAENELLGKNEKVMGVIWDGTGLGEDGQIWGSEFFLWNNGQMTRQAHLNYFKLIAGDKMAKEPRLSALSILHKPSGYKDHMSPEHIQFYTKVRINSKIKTSSMGRLFDAVASILEVCQVQSYEGEAAMKLESLARQFWNDQPNSISMEWENCLPKPEKLLQKMLESKANGVQVSQLAYNFHLALVKWIELEANKLKIKKIAFSGGVFQNALLVDMIIEFLREGYELFFHKQLSPNDENIAFGQLNLFLLENY
ncbi:MAG: carbamoyltransferase HypF [Bacteroidia bacterium]|nr:carbamoyltransferase HypF [Bacteroidia bacterium]